MANYAIGQNQLYEEISYEVFAICTNPKDGKPAEIGKYFVSVEILDLDKLNVGNDQTNNFDISIGSVDLLQFHVESIDLPFALTIGPFPISDDDLELSIRSLDNGKEDVLKVPSVLCGYTSHQGLDQPGYFCDGIDSYVIAQASPTKITNRDPITTTNVYLLVDDNEIVKHKSYSGLFEQVLDQEHYEVQLYAIANHEVEEFYQSIEIGEALTANPTLQCLSLCGAYVVEVRCLGFDLALEKTVVNGAVFSIGDTVLYDIKIINEGSVPAYDVVITDMIPVGLAFSEDYNPQWDEMANSLPIPLILPGSFEIRRIALIITNQSPDIEIVNTAEIVIANDIADVDSPAFDFDSTPDNENSDEDDLDVAIISVLENLCDATFEVVFIDQGALCHGSSFTLTSDLISGTAPVQFFWILNGDTVSMQQSYTVDSPDDSNFGQYHLIVKDANGCIAQKMYNVESVTGERVSCVNDLNLSVSNSCSINIRPDMLTLNDISGIDNFLLEIRDSDGNIIDPADITVANLSEPLEVKLINPCTNDVVCWSNINVEFKIDPQFDYYQQELEMSCNNLRDESPELIIANYNALNVNDSILSKDEFEVLINTESCMIGWEIETRDIFLSNLSCGSGLLGRIYSAIHTSGKKLDLDTAILTIVGEPIDNVIFPVDVSNLSCDSDLSPLGLNSLPYVIRGGDTTVLSVNNANRSEQPCNLIVSYTDQSLGQGCAFGSDKILRSWSIVDWCSNQVKSDNQYLFKMDKVPPLFELANDTLRVELNGFLCEGDIDLSNQIVLSDNCDTDPEIIIDGYSYDGYFIQSVPAGTHQIELHAIDDCGNSTTESVIVVVRENTPPVPIVMDGLKLTYTESSSMWISALSFDNASGDACGPVIIKIARSSEVNQIEANGVLSTFEMRDICDEGIELLDVNADGELTTSEIFRDKIYLCCSDIGSIVKVVIRVIDASGNYSDIESKVEVVSKSESIACDDGDPCTKDDVMVEGCPCQGIYDYADRDQDNIMDCIDEDFIFCLNNEVVSIQAEEIDFYLDKGATPGPCDQGEMASISGYISTWENDMVEHVEVNINQSQGDTTSSGGQYAFPNRAMYESYTLLPYKNDDVLNGVSALDMVLIQQYLLGIADLESKVHYVAADINRDGRISAIDLAQLRKVLLGQISEFPSNNSWVFVPENPGFNWNDPYNFDESIIIENLEKDESDINWMAIKVGDVSGNVIANSLKANGRSPERQTIKVVDEICEAGKEIVVPFYMENGVDINALQLGFKTEGYEIVGIESGRLIIDNNDFHINEDREFNLVSTQIDLNHGMDLFSLVIVPSATTTLRELLTLDGGYTADLGCGVGGREYQVELDFSKEILLGKSTSDKLHQNAPNPFNISTDLIFSLVKDKEVGLMLYDLNGRLLMDRSGYYSKGFNKVSITSNDLNIQSGAVFIELKTDSYSSTRTMVLTKE